MLEFLIENLDEGSTVAADAKLVGYEAWLQIQTGLKGIGRIL